MMVCPSRAHQPHVQQHTAMPTGLPYASSRARTRSTSVLKPGREGSKEGGRKGEREREREIDLLHMIQGAINQCIHSLGSTSSLCHMDAGMEPSAANSLVMQGLPCLSVLEEGRSLTQLKALFTSSRTDSCLPSMRMWPVPLHVPGIRATTEMGPPDPLTKRTAGQEK